MRKFLLKLFVKNYNDVSNQDVRAKYGILSGIVGIIVNIILCSVKIIAGLLSGSVSILADGINNLSDAGTSIVTMVGFKLSSQPADEKHPFGHERIEYISAMIVSIIILSIFFAVLVFGVNQLLGLNASLQFLLDIANRILIYTFILVFGFLSYFDSKKQRIQKS